MNRPLFLQLFCSSLLLVAIGCANPAADAPQADVQEPAAAPAAAPASEEAVDYALGGTIGFVGAKVTGSHDGGFGVFEGTASVVGGAPETSSVKVTIDTTSLWADNEKLTGHLKSDDFFGVETFPTATFESTAITASEEGGYILTGNLELHGVTKQISFPAEIMVNEEGFTAKSEFSINRFDFDIVYPGKTDDLIRDEVLVRLDLTSAMTDADGEMGEDEMSEEGGVEESEGS